VKESFKDRGIREKHLALWGGEGETSGKGFNLLPLIREGTEKRGKKGELVSLVTSERENKKQKKVGREKKKERKKGIKKEGTKEQGR